MPHRRGTACAGSFPLGRSDRAAPALAAVPSAGLSARGKLVRQMSARAVPEALRAERVRIRGTGQLAGPLRGMRAGSPLVRAGCGPARADRLCRSGCRPGRCSSRTERMAAAAPGGVPAVPGGPADQPVGDDALLFLGVAFPAAVGQAVPQHAADVLGIIQADAQAAGVPGGAVPPRATCTGPRRGFLHGLAQRSGIT